MDRRAAEPRRRRRDQAAARERFLTRGCASRSAARALRADLRQARIHDDGVLYFYFVRGLFGADVVAQAYQFGSAFWTRRSTSPRSSSPLAASSTPTMRVEVGTAVASNVAAVLTLYLGWRILRELDLPRGAGPPAARAVRDAALFYAS